MPPASGSPYGLGASPWESGLPTILGNPLLGLVAALAALPVAAAVPTGGFTVKHVYPHDPGAFTEGLFYLRGDLFESTGMPGQSNVRRVRLQDGVNYLPKPYLSGKLTAVIRNALEPAGVAPLVEEAV